MNELHKDDRKIREMLVDGPVECEVSGDGKGWFGRKVIGYRHDVIGKWYTSSEVALPYARLPRPKERRPWTAEEIMAHGVFEIHGDIVRTVGSTEDIVITGGSGRWNKASFINAARAVCLELRDGILCDTVERVELYKEVTK